jgi:hypothetical protein
VNARAFQTPRQVPSRLLPTAGAALVVVLAFPVFLAGGWPLAGWALGAVLWLAAQAVSLVLPRLRSGSAGNLAASGVVGISMMFRAVAVGVVLIAVAASDPEVAIAAALVYALAYTLELALSLLAYFGSEPVA